MMLNEIFNRIRRHRGERTCMALGHRVPQEATDGLRQAYLDGNIAPSVSYDCERCGKKGTAQYLPGIKVNPRRLVPF